MDIRACDVAEGQWFEAATLSDPGTSRYVWVRPFRAPLSYLIPLVNVVSGVDPRYPGFHIATTTYYDVKEVVLDYDDPTIISHPHIQQVEAIPSHTLFTSGYDWLEGPADDLRRLPLWYKARDMAWLVQMGDWRAVMRGPLDSTSSFTHGIVTFPTLRRVEEI